VAKLKLTRRVGPLALVLTAYDVWKRLPPKQRKQVAKLAAKHGPKIAKNAVKVGSKVRQTRRGR
jgi:TRAP-type C4-dicarboxylate transport system substrate-binding protein